MRKQHIYTLQEDIGKRLQNPAFKKAWEESETEYVLACKLIEARLGKKLTQKELAKKVGTSQAAISRIEAMNGNPSLNLLKRIAQALNTQLTVSL